MTTVDVQFNPHGPGEYVPGRPRSRRGGSPVARMRAHAVSEQALRLARVDDVLARAVRDAVVSFRQAQR